MKKFDINKWRKDQKDLYKEQKSIKEISKIINTTCTAIGDYQDVCTPLDITSKDINNLIFICQKLYDHDSEKNFLDNEMQMDYEEFFLTESWLNISGKGGYQKVHNHSNSIISGTLYLKSEDGHPPLTFKKQKMEFEPFISLTEHYKKGNPNTAHELSFPCTQDTMLVFNSYLYHGHDASQIESERVGLAWNGLVNFVEKDKDLYRIRFVKET